MSTNLVEKRYEDEVRKQNKSLERNIALIEDKFNTALKRIDNIRKSISRDIEDSNYSQRTTELIDKLNQQQEINENLLKYFVDNTTTSSGLNEIISRYGDNSIKLATYASNGQYVTKEEFVDDSTEVVDGDYRSSRFVKNDSFDTLTGINAIEGELPATGIISSPGYNRSLFINIYNSGQNIVDMETLSNSLAFSKEYNPIRSLDRAPSKSVPFIVLERINKINSFDFGIEYITKAETVKLYIENGGVPELIETGLHTNSGAFVKRFYGNFIIEDLGNQIKSSYILNNSEKSLFDGDLPEFKFRLSFDDLFIYIYLEEVKPYRLTYSNIESINDPDFYNSEFNKSQVFIRDILELMICTDEDMTDDKIILSIKNKYGASVELFGKNVSDTTKSILNILAPFRDNPSLLQNVYIIPNYLVNFSLKDNSFITKDSFVVGQMFDRNDILELPFSIMEIKPKGKTQIQLEGVKFTNGNKINLISKPNRNTIKNTIYSSTSKNFIRSKTISQIVQENDYFIKDHYVDDSVSYHSRILISTTLNSDLKVDTDKIPDYVIDEIGKYVKTDQKDVFFCKYFVIYKEMNKELIINNISDLKSVIENNFIPLKQFSHIEGLVPVDNIEENKIPLFKSNINKSSYYKSLPLFSDIYSGLNIDENLFKGLISVETTILPRVYEFENVVLGHLSVLDDDTVYGKAPRKSNETYSLPKQVKILRAN